MADLNAKERDEMPASEFAVPSKRKLPIHDEHHIRLAWDMVDRTQGLSAAERAEARRRIKAAAHKHGIDTSDWSTPAADMVLADVEILTDAAGGTMRARFKGTIANVVNDNSHSGTAILPRST